ncbi:hypothetical protein L218DRAFT_870149 [Marasmius fiardii PR-910]|nr:hypothetical protein L218DRAFT_870149 [Marasmius fiardii PR-910]
MLFDICQDETALPGIRAYGIQAMQNLFDAHHGIIESRVFQTHEANKRRTKEPELKVGIKVYLSTKNLKLPKGRAFFYPLPAPSTDIYTIPGHWDMAQICEYRRRQAVIRRWKDPKVSRVNVDPGYTVTVTHYNPQSGPAAAIAGVSNLSLNDGSSADSGSVQGSSGN